MKLYLAGPLFTTGEKWHNFELATELRQFGYECFLPQEHEFQERGAQAIFDGDVSGLDWAEVIVANIDGPDVDSGTAWELGYMHARNKPALLYRTDFRAAGDFDGQPCNLMLSVPASAYIDNKMAEGNRDDPSRLAVKLHEVLRRWRPPE